MKKKTAGQIVYDHLQKDEIPGTVQERSAAMLENYMKNVVEAVERGYNSYENEFFIVVLTTKIKTLGPNTYRNQFLHRKTCPSPSYDQTVFKFDKRTDDLEYLWTLPSIEQHLMMLARPDFVHPEEREVFNFVKLHDNGSLDELARKLNNEEKQLVEIIH